MDSSRAEANTSVAKIRDEERNEAMEEKQAALEQLHHKVQAQLKYAE